jgi:bifunctional DNA-binding transcriptional regulator/antitoxin component of YhaV-PrlF toxin-antitoxin module
MTTIVKNKTGLIVPAAVQRRAGFKVGDELEFKASGGVITILPKLPSADDEYTPAQRRIIDAQLDEAEKAPLHGPFNTADQAIAHIKGELKKRAAARHKRAGGPILPVC